MDLTDHVPTPGGVPSGHTWVPDEYGLPSRRIGAACAGGSPAIGATSCTPVLVQDRDYEYRGVRGAAVTRFGGCWVMVYGTHIEPKMFLDPAFGPESGGFRN